MSESFGETPVNTASEALPADSGPFRRRLFTSKWLFWSLAIIILTLDLWSKNWAETTLTKLVPLPGSEASVRVYKHSLETPDGVDFIPGFLHFKWAENYGAAFSIGSGNWLALALLSIGVLGILFYYVYRTPSRRWFFLLCLGLISGGALGNLHDRLFYRTPDTRLSVGGEANSDYGKETRAVRDFLYWPFDIPIYSTAFLEKGETPRKWPIFNVADASIVGGVIGLSFIFLLTPDPNARKRRRRDASSP